MSDTAQALLLVAAGTAVGAIAILLARMWSNITGG